MFARPVAFARLLVVIAMVLPALLSAAPPQTGPAIAAPASQAGAADVSMPRSESGRWIVRLEAPPLAQAPVTRPEFATMVLPRTADGRLQLDSPAAQQYTSQLQQQQAVLFQQMQRAFPGMTMQHSYQTLFNGIAVSLPGATDATIERLRAMEGVADVYPDLHYELQLFASLSLINAPALWNSPAIGGQGNAGAGVKIAVLDSGIKIDNLFFDPAGFSYPPGYPRGETEHTTPKIIVARSYFRPDAPPVPGHETPQPGPLDSSHGTHVAGIAAGVSDTEASFAGVTRTISGVAPRAHLMNYKVFYANETIFGGAFSIELVAALEDAVADGADIINNSWGGRADVAPAYDPIVQAAEAAVDAGVTVVFSAGNEGPDRSTAGAPAYSDKVISVGANTSAETIAAGFVDVVAPGEVPEDLTGRRFGRAAFGEPVQDRLIGPAPYMPVGGLDGVGLACDPLPEGSMSGQIAVVERGVCEFSLKAFNVQQAGAVAAIIFNTEAGGEEIIGMAAGAQSDQVVIPAVFVQRSMGVGMLNWHADHGMQALAQIDPQGRVIESPADVVPPISSRGPTFQATLKPDVLAPGVNILSAGFAGVANPAEASIEQHLGFGIATGTSMAGPHVAGGAALLKQVHPDWSPLDIKSALMSTAELQLWVDIDQSEPASVLDQGAGRIDLSRAATPGLLFDRPSLSFGNLSTTVGQPTRSELVVQARNVSGATQTYAITPRVTEGEGFIIATSTPAITAAPGETVSFAVSIEIPADQPPGDYAGLVELSGPEALHIPVWARTLPAQPGPKVLLVDNDGSTSLGLQDYSGYYANLLIEQGISLDYLDVDALAPAVQTLPPIGELQRYEIVLWFTGDNFVPSGTLPVPTPLTPADQNLLIAYLQSGGSLLATGQDLTDASDISPVPPDPRYGRSDLYHGYLGARFVQDNVFTDTLTPERIVVGAGTQPWTSDIALDLSAPPAGVVPGDETGAGNQTSIDEITVVDADPRTPDEYTTPLMRAATTGGESAASVALNRGDEPTLEKPGLGLPYRSIYLSFGLEGVRSDTGMTTRKELLQALLYWLVDRPAVSLDNSEVTVNEPGQSVSFTANPVSNTPTSFVLYRWDFGDGSPVLETTEPTVIHDYAEPGSYFVRVEVTDSWGHKALSSLQGVDEQAQVPQVQAAADEPAPTVSGPVTFAETGQTVQGRFLEFWQQHGGLAVFGYPLTAQSTTEPVSQTFERTRFEYHPQNAPPYDVLLGRMGVEALEAQGRDWWAFQTVENAPEGCLYFEQTRHSLCSPFKEYWQTHGLEFDGQPGSSYAESLALFGFPISEPQQETLADGVTRTVQWFERARFEYHPDQPAEYQVMLGLLSRSSER